MCRVRSISALLLLTSCVPGCLGNGRLFVYDFNNLPVVVKGDVTGSAALEWTLETEPGRNDAVGFTFNDEDVFRYIPHTGVIPPHFLDESVLEDAIKVEASYDPRFAIYNTSTRGVGFRLAGLRREDAGTYTCRYESLSFPIIANVVLFVYEVPGRPVDLEVNPQILIDKVTRVTLKCEASSTSLPAAHRPTMLYAWSRNWVDIDRTGPPERHAVLGDSGQTLEVSPVHHTDITYTCTVSENGTRLANEDTVVRVPVLHGPKALTLNPLRPSARVNEDLEITASVDCNPACIFTWSVAGRFISQGSILILHNFQSCDANNYTVQVDNAYGTADVTVEVTLDVSPDPPNGRVLSTGNQFIANGAGYDDVAPRTMERALHTDIVGWLSDIQTIPAGHQPSGGSGMYESIDETGQPVQPAHQVYLTLRE